MTDDGTEGTPADTHEKIRDRDEVLDWLEDAMRESHRKAESGRMTDPERERARQGWHQTLAKLANAYRLLARDQDLDELAERIDAIEQQQQGGGSGYQIK